jgi:hypothetical protein
MVDHASDDELFASGYLRSHLTLAVAELEGGRSLCESDQRAGDA